jgi:hypothetical protein
MEVYAASTALPNKRYIFILCKQFYSVISILKTIGHGNPDNNLESCCIFNDVIPNSDCITSSDETMKELERVRNDSVVA